jgi:hypothetical protein
MPHAIISAVAVCVLALWWLRGESDVDSSTPAMIPASPVISTGVMVSMPHATASVAEVMGSAALTVSTKAGLVAVRKARLVV